MEYRRVSRAEVDELRHQANTERAVRAAATRRVCRWLDCLYDLEDPREAEAAKARSDDSVGFLEQLYRLEDQRG